MIRNTPDTISLGQGVVYYGPPESAYTEIKRLDHNIHHHIYGPVSGIDELKHSLRKKLSLDNNITIDNYSRINITAGSNMGFMNAILAIADANDEIILNTPYYFNHEMAIRMLGCTPVLVNTDDDFQPDINSLRTAITSSTRAIVTISPNNPCGTVYNRACLETINQLCRENGIYHISDEAYEYFTYNSCEHFSPGSLAGADEYTISLFSLSKAYGFASWRIGYMVVPERLIEPILKVQDTNLICPPLISQYAAIGALKAGVEYSKNKLPLIEDVRHQLLDAFSEITSFCTIPISQGAFYFLVRVHTDQTGMKIVSKLIEKYRIAVIPGEAFGIHEGCYLRIAYAALTKDYALEGIKRLIDGLTDLID